MDTTDASLNWEWQDELLATLDADSPLGTAHTLWEDINQSEGDVTGMLETTPASKFNGDHKFIWEGKANHDSPNELMLEDGSHIKRRRMLQFEGEEDIGLFAYDASLEASPFSSLENYEDVCGAHQNDDAQMLEPTSTTLTWFDDNASDNANVERCDDSSWLGGSLRERECQPKRFLEGQTQQELPLIIESAICNTKINEGKLGKSSRAELSAVSHLTRTLSGRSMSSTKMATPVAYPFTVVKPSGMQGDVTLNDINKRIMMAHDKLGGHKRRGLPTNSHDSRGDDMGSSTLLAKSVVALTKIHTEGNGTITIMRTKN
eukprot:c20625_g1_i1 orf=593-1546(+)